MARNSSDDNDEGINYKLVATGFFAFSVAISLIIIAFKFDEGNHSITFLVCLLGFILGWIIAIFTTPYDTKDETQLNRFSKLVGTFLTGYILSKCDKLFEKVTSPEFVFTTLQGGRLLLFLCFFGLAWIVVFVYRQYASGKID